MKNHFISFQSTFQPKSTKHLTIESAPAFLWFFNRYVSVHEKSFLFFLKKKHTIFIRMPVSFSTHQINIVRFHFSVEFPEPRVNFNIHTISDVHNSNTLLNKKKYENNILNVSMCGKCVCTHIRHLKCVFKIFYSKISLFAIWAH